MNIGCEKLRCEIELMFGKLRHAVNSACQEIIIKEGFFSSNKYLLRGYMTFSDIPGEELFVISVDCKLEFGKFFFESDLSRGGGIVIDDGPSLVSACEESRRVLDWLAKLDEFIKISGVEIISRFKR